MERRPLGNTGFHVSALGFGAGPSCDAALSEDAAAALLHGVLDAGINLIDTAPSYGLSEERIGRHLHGRRGEFVLSTKCGYGVPGVEDWTPPCITRGVDLALRRLRTDIIDVMHLHSCPVEVLQRPGVVEALARAVEQGKVRAAAYSGDNDALEEALGRAVRRGADLGDLFDQRAIDGRSGARRGVGVIAKRPLGNAPWRFTSGRGARPGDLLAPDAPDGAGLARPGLERAGASVRGLPAGCPPASWATTVDNLPAQPAGAGAGPAAPEYVSPSATPSAGMTTAGMGSFEA